MADISDPDEIHVGARENEPDASSRDLHEFLEGIGTDSSNWDSGQPEIPLVPVEGTHGTYPSDSLPSRQDHKFAEKPRVGSYVHEILPHRAFFWLAGVMIIIFYAPRLLDRYLDSVARLVYGGLDFTRRYERIRADRGGKVVKKLKVRHLNMSGMDSERLACLASNVEVEPGFKIFDIEEELISVKERDHVASASAATFYEPRAYSRYALDTTTGELRYRGTDVSLSVEGSSGRARSRCEKSGYSPTVVANR